jgi:thioredoxin-related protein
MAAFLSRFGAICVVAALVIGCARSDSPPGPVARATTTSDNADVKKPSDDADATLVGDDNDATPVGDDNDATPAGDDNDVTPVGDDAKSLLAKATAGTNVLDLTGHVQSNGAGGYTFVGIKAIPAKNLEKSFVVSEASDDDADAKWADHTQKLPFVIGYEKGMAEAKAQNKPAMFFVTTTWCGWCKKHAEENFNDSEIQDLLGKFVLVIVDGDTEKDALITLGANQGFPHFIFKSSKDEKLGEQLGYSPVEEFKTLLEDTLAKAGEA